MSYNSEYDYALKLYPEEQSCTGKLWQPHKGTFEPVTELTHRRFEEETIQAVLEAAAGELARILKAGAQITLTIRNEEV